jgi:enoyl-[acyl-carrier protein] reductase III
MRFENKVALVTGSTRGLGRKTILRYAKEGADIVVNYKKNEDLAKEVVQEAEQMGRKAIAIQADLESAEDIKEMFAKVKESFGHLDIFVANAAATAFKPLSELKSHNIDRTLSLVIRGFILCTQEAAKLMDGRGGRIVGVSGVDSIRHMPGHGLLGAAKAAMESLIRSFSAELSDKNINVNGVCLGGFETDSSRLYGGEAYQYLKEEFTRLSTRNRFGTLEDMSNVILFLSSQESDYIAGQTIIVDGGMAVQLGHLNPLEN